MTNPIQPSYSTLGGIFRTHSRVIGLCLFAIIAAAYYFHDYLTHLALPGTSLGLPKKGIRNVFHPHGYVPGHTGGRGTEAPVGRRNKMRVE